MGSDDITDCICNIGFEGSDGRACVACEIGKYKGVNGSGVCLDCTETSGSVHSSCNTAVVVPVMANGPEYVVEIPSLGH
eukprot:3927089-Rhodomonas_salina.1